MNDQNIDELLDGFLAKQPARASDSFMSEFNSRMESEKRREADLDAMLKAQTIEASADFTARVMRKIRLARIGGVFKHVIPSIAAAASVALIFTVFTTSAKQSVESTGYLGDLYDIDGQMSSWDSFAQMSMDYDGSTSSAIAAYLNDDTI